MQPVTGGLHCVTLILKRNICFSITWVTVTLISGFMTHIQRSFTTHGTINIYPQRHIRIFRHIRPRLKTASVPLKSIGIISIGLFQTSLSKIIITLLFMKCTSGILLQVKIFSVPWKSWIIFRILAWGRLN